MASAAPADLKEVLSMEDLPFGRLHDLRKEIHSHVDLRGQMQEVLSDFGSVARKLSSENKADVRKGVAHWLLGQADEAAKILGPARASRERSYFLGLSHLESQRYTEAAAALKEAQEADGSDDLVSAASCEAKILAGRHEEAEPHVEKLLKKKDAGAEALYLGALLADVQGRHGEALQGYEKAMEADPGHAKSLFRMAYIMDLNGEEARALELYEQLRKLRPMHLNTVMNLGVIYEDRGDFERAAECFQSVLEYFPGHRRARLYMKDAQASMIQFYDEESARREARQAQILAQPVAEISFSPRVRGALQKLGVVTLDDLVQKTEEELLVIPNFGRTSLKELKEFLASKSLALATAAGAGGLIETPVEGSVDPVAAGEDALNKNLSELEWSGRIRKLFEKLGMVTVSDLLKKTEKDLLKQKNLGVTSIKEIRKKLSLYGLSLQAE